MNMLKHIVMWKLKDFAEERTKRENALLIRDRLLALRDKIPEIKAMEVGININSSGQAYDAVLYSEFEDEQSLAVYQNHPEHRKVSEFVSKVRIGRAVADYFMD